eukprot:1194802-Alexandrium_andersonii.AAC.1
MPGCAALPVAQREASGTASLRHRSGTVPPTHPGAIFIPRSGYSCDRRAFRSYNMRNCLRRSKLELRGPMRP